MPIVDIVKNAFNSILLLISIQMTFRPQLGLPQVDKIILEYGLNKLIGT